MFGPYMFCLGYELCVIDHIFNYQTYNQVLTVHSMPIFIKEFVIEVQLMGNLSSIKSFISLTISIIYFKN